MKIKPACKEFNTDSFSLALRVNYAHVTYLDPSDLDLQTLNEVRSHLREYYQGRDFVLINERINDIVINPKYHKDSLKNMKAVAIVSKNENWRERLCQEQKNSTRSFAFFKDIEDAQLWADHFMEYRIEKT
ncbi:MAG TPA: hypothetical protein ENH91_04930 [Leeuwenhoekiella sp.]|nr:hypothetical protein [Leeuwenhoekiella sp.]